MGWAARFNHPIKWGARTLNTLHEPRDFISSFPEFKQTLPAWQAASEALLEASKHGGIWLELARIGMMHALLEQEPITEPSASNKAQWRKRELAGDR